MQTLFARVVGALGVSLEIFRIEEDRQQIAGDVGLCLILEVRRFGKLVTSHILREAFAVVGR